MSEKLVLIDGHSIIHRAFYGVPELSNASGFHTNGIYGFLNILFKIMDEENPQYLCVAFDRKEKTFRHKMFAEYKGTRKPMPEELREQIPMLQEVLKAMQVTVVSKAGYEADDILGTLAKKAEKDGKEVTLISGDRDLLQIASEHIKIRIPKTKGGKTETEDYYASDVKEKYQVTPEQFIELKALMGDTADNIPGVPKVGEKTATSLMVEYGSIDEIYRHVEEISKKSIRESLQENRELADLSKVLATIKTDCELPVTMEEMKLKNFYTREAYEYFQKLEFRNFLPRFDEKASEDSGLNGSYQCITDLTDCETVFTEAEQADRASFLVIKEEGECLAVCLCFEKRKACLILPEGFITVPYLQDKMKTLSKKITLVTFDLKDVYDFAAEEAKQPEDLKIAAYLLYPLKSEYFIEDLGREYLHIAVKEREELFQKEKLKSVMETKRDLFTEYAGNLTEILFDSYEPVMKKLEEEGMLPLYRNIEMPLCRVLYDMEQAGVYVCRDALLNYGKMLSGQLEQLEKQIYEEAGEEFNIQSPKQLGEILFVKLGFKGGKKTKTGYSTAADVLEKLAPDHEIVSNVLEYRTLAKLKSTYAEGLLSCIAEDGRIHTTFQQTVTATGRISSVEPNLQNIPMRMELGRQIRKAFLPKEGCVFLDADYSQIELRLLAHMSGDEELIRAYNEDADIHRITASKVFHVPFDEVTDLQRRNAKAVNFGIVYGISSFGLSQDLSITRKEAEQYIESYFAQYPKVKEFLDRTVEEAEKNGYVKTLYGRKRPLPELKSSKFMQRAFGKRVAMNAPIQGTAADVMKIAMIRVAKDLKEAGVDARILIQVHDELLLEVKEECLEETREILKNGMEQAAKFAVELIVDIHDGKNWYEAK